ncbi:hypothetical protein [Streptomyces litchfieldiae]|uniref:Uncharacterized protein n=1 Tax=Streptomyces litchfieldiae TaxID=3075543 RepID=A0ABU2MQP4_9ACTN|nr:hypothetical protein [Streptomyces sp. DSM 44938]MDT0343955.1 hypothetical protein [Streptomyces sp. DSM 44938]
MTTDDDFMAVIDRILSAQHVMIHAAAGAWYALAGAGTAERDRLAGAAADAEAEPGVGLIELADRIKGTASWAEGASAVAQQIAGQLQAAGEASARAAERALALLVEYEAAAVDMPADDAIDPTMVSAAIRKQEERDRLLAEARSVLDQLSSDVGRVTGGQAPPSPEGDRTGGGNNSLESVPRSADRNGTTDSTTRSDRNGSPDRPTRGDRDNMIEGTPPPNSTTPDGDYPSYLSVLGPENEEFGGWVQSPNTGYLVDPATGREFDPGSGRWIDPVTGLPFGESTEYATRLSGLGTGPGAMATGVGLAAIGAGGPGTIGGGGGLAGLYGGVVPPSVAHPGPAQQQVIREAHRNLNQRAAVASRFAMREAAQGGRPFAPPPAATGAVSRSNGDRSGESGRLGRPTDLTEDPEVWSARRSAAKGVLGE